MSRVSPRAAWSALVGAYMLSVIGSALGQPASGTTVVDFIASLRARGITIIYSSDLVPASLEVVTAPAAADPLRQLEQVLAEHDLALEPGPRGSWLVVRARPMAPAAPSVTDTTRDFRPPPPALESVVVTASRYALVRSTAASARQIDRLQLENAPTLGEDALRTTHALPGLTSSGLTARVNVRGGEANETLVLLDGVRLYNPFHLKDFQSLFGGISPRVIERIEVRTGGYPAEFGDRMSAVIDMRSIEPEERRHFELGVSTLSSSFLSSGRFADDQGFWVTSARRGNLDLLIDAAGSDAGTPRYTDFFSKLGFSFSDRLTLTSGMLALDDKISLFDGDTAEAAADYDDTYLWVELQHNPTSRLTARYALAHAHLAGDRAGRIADPTVSIGQLRDRQRFSVDTLSADWFFEVGDRHLLKWGIELDDGMATYDFASSRELPVPILVAELALPGNVTETALALDDRQRAVYLGYRTQPLSRLTAEIGIRWDERSHLDEDQLSGRASVLLDLGDRATLRASWGRYYQPQGIDELQVGDGLVALSPAQEAEHSVLSLEYLFGDTLSLRAELYRKEFEQVRPRFENLFTRVSLLPELLPDRVMLAPLRAEADGLEISLEGERDRWLWWVNWTRSSVEDRLPGRSANRSWEEPWSAKGGALRTGARWTLSGALTFRSGWPVSGLALVGTELVAGPYNAEAFESFRSLDLRASRDFALERGSLELFFELNNALNDDNPCCLDYEVEVNDALEPQRLTIDIDDWLPAIPSIGFLWQF